MHFRLAPASVLGLLLGCQPTMDATTGSSALSGTGWWQPYEIAAAPNNEHACPADGPTARFVGRSPSRCTRSMVSGAGGYWQRRPLFDGQVEMPLAGYCTFTWNSGSNAKPDRSVLPAGAAPDCAVSAALAQSSFETQAKSQLQDAFLEQTHALGAPPAGGQARISVAVIDSAVTDLPMSGLPRGDSAHGPVMATLVNRLGCVGPSCAVRLFSSLALPLRNVNGTWTEDRVNGGHIGRQADLATAVFDAVEAMRRGSNQQPMILSLSVGWSPRWGGTGAPSSFSPPVRAVFDALAYARCRGALIYAATGNHDRGPQTGSDYEGAYFPAGWERLGAPSLPLSAGISSCVGSAGGVSHRPLVRGVGGVDSDDQPLRNAAPGSRPRLLAPAEFVTTRPTRNSAFSRIYTGSSIGPVVASAAAAWVWSLRPAMEADAIARLVFDSAVPTALDAEQPVPAPAKRISICRAVAQAAVQFGRPAPACPGTLPSGPPSNLPPAPALPSQSALPLDWEGSVPFCGGSNQSSFGSKDPCPVAQYHGSSLDPYVQPQPTGPVCSVCFLSPLGELNLVLQSFEGLVLEPSLLMVTEKGKEIRVNLASAPLGSGEARQFDDIPMPDGKVTKAYFEYVVDGPDGFGGRSESVLID